MQISAEHGEPVPGFTFDDCTPFRGDEPFWQPRWKDGRSIAQLTGTGRYHIEIELHDAELYAVRGDFQMAFGWGREKAPPPLRSLIRPNHRPISGSRAAAARSVRRRAPT